MPNFSEDPLINFETIYTNQEIENFENSTNPEYNDEIDEVFNVFKNGNK